MREQLGLPLFLCHTLIVTLGCLLNTDKVLNNEGSICTSNPSEPSALASYSTLKTVFIPAPERARQREVASLIRSSQAEAKSSCCSVIYLFFLFVTGSQSG